jgi:diguanylate cyclase
MHLHSNAHTIFGLVQQTDPHIVTTVRRIAHETAPDIARVFYAYMQSFEAAKAFLDHTLVEQRLSKTMASWIQSIFSVETAHDAEDLSTLNEQVGHVHTRINVPLDLVNIGFRLIKKEMIDRTFPLLTETNMHGNAALYIMELLDLANEDMQKTYIDDLLSNTRRKQSLQMFFSGHNLALECEKLRSFLFQWQRAVVMQIFADPLIPSNIDMLRNSEFGMWMAHKSELTFGNSNELSEVFNLISDIDTTIHDFATTNAQNQTVHALAHNIDSKITNISFLLATISQHALEMEAGRDPLTRLLGRRFIPTVFQREVELSRTLNKTFGIIMLDIDHFKKINDQLGHAAGDQILSQFAEILQGSIRPGDFAFRYGGEEFLLLLTEMTADTLRHKAEHIRKQIESTRFVINDNQNLTVTSSFGCALHNGHPDYEYVIKQADAALYAAKHAGRNCVVYQDSSVENAAQ